MWHWELCAALSLRPDSQILMLLDGPRHAVCQKIEKEKPNQRCLIGHSWADDLRHGTRKAVCQQAPTQPLFSFRASGSKRGICGSSTSQDLFISYIPCEVAGGTRGSWNLNSPSFTLPDQNTLRKPQRLSHICRWFFCFFLCFSLLFLFLGRSPAFCLPKLRSKHESANVPEGRRERGRGGWERHWSACVTRCSLPQVNEIPSAFPPFGSIAASGVSKDTVVSQPLAFGQNSSSAGNC